MSTHSFSRRRVVASAGVGALALAATATTKAEALPTGSAYVGLPYTVITEPTDAAVQAGITKWLNDRTGYFCNTRLAFAFLGTADLTTPLLPANITQIQGARWEGMAKRGTILRWSNSTVPVLSAYGTLRNWMFEDFTFQGVGNAKGIYLKSDTTKTNQDGCFRLIEWLGSWDYAYGLDGPVTANCNSEILWDRPAMGNDASFATAWLWSGLTPGNSQENQFLNYTIRDSKFEGSHGDYLRFDYGGAIRVEGFNSWFHTGQSNGGVPQGRMVYLPKGNNGDSVMFLSAENVRAEMRSTKSVLIDSTWSSASSITFDTLMSAPNAFKIGDFEHMLFRGDARVTVRGSHLGGHIGLHGTAKPRVILDNTAAPTSTGIDWTQPTSSAGKGILRTYDSSSAANVKIR